SRDWSSDVCSSDHPATFQILDRMICAAVPKGHLHRLGPKCQCQKLMTQADAEDGEPLLLQQALDHGDRIGAGSSWISGAIGQEHAIRIAGENLLRRSLGRYDGQLASEVCERAQDVVLGAVINSDDSVFRLVQAAIALSGSPGRFGPAIALKARYFCSEIHTFQ